MKATLLKSSGMRSLGIGNLIFLVGIALTITIEQAKYIKEKRADIFEVEDDDPFDDNEQEVIRKKAEAAEKRKIAAAKKKAEAAKSKAAKAKTEV